MIQGLIMLIDMFFSINEPRKQDLRAYQRGVDHAFN